MAPTYRNDSTTQSWRGSGFSGEAVSVPPGHSIATRYTITEVFMTKTSDIPYYNPNIEWTTVNSSGETKTRTVDSTYARGLEVYNRAGSSGEVQIKFNSASADYVAKLVPGGSIEFSEAEILNRVSSVILECPLGAVFDFVVAK
jgi:hypothetical protein